MDMIAKVLFYAGAIVLIVALIMAITGSMVIAAPGGWLNLALVLVVFSLAVKYVI